MAAKPFKTRKDGQAGAGCLGLFGLVFLCAGLAVAWFLWGMLWEAFRSHSEYVEGTCVIVGKQLIENSDSDGSTYRPEFVFEHYVSQGVEEGEGGPRRAYRVTGYDGMQVSSSGRAGKQEILDAYEVGGTYPCWYDPQDPSKAVLVKPSFWNLLWGLFPLPFVGVGLFMTLYAIRTASKRTTVNAFTQADAAPKARDEILGALATSQGGTLAVRLAPETTEKAAAIGLGCFGIVWTGLTGTFWVKCLLDGEWVGVIFLALFVLVGLGILGAAVWQALIGWGVGETLVEVSKAGLAPGERFELLVSQGGHQKINRLDVALICEEQATYRQGTNTSTAKEVVAEIPLGSKEHFVLTGRPELLKLSAQVPAEAMHSLAATKNKILWKVRVQGDVERWPDFKREFLIRVVPVEQS